MFQTVGVETFLSLASGSPDVRGFLHRPSEPVGNGIVLAHGAGSDANAPLLVALAQAFSDAGFFVLRCDLPFRQLRPHGPPFPGMASRDRAGLKRAVQEMRKFAPERVILGGHSYGGRQSSILAAEEPGLTDRLLLLAYPLHPPRRAGDLRTAHFPNLTTPCVFVHGTRDPLGSIEELQQAIALIPTPATLHIVEGAGHELAGKKLAVMDVVRLVVEP
jgi:uncharacterized protein